MIYKFSEASKNALENAEKIAVELGHSYIGTEHILYGLVLEEKGIAFKVLNKQGIDSGSIENKIKEIKDKKNTYFFLPVEISFSINTV